MRDPLAVVRAVRAGTSRLRTAPGHHFDGRAIRSAPRAGAASAGAASGSASAVPRRRRSERRKGPLRICLVRGRPRGPERSSTSRMPSITTGTPRAGYPALSATRPGFTSRSTALNIRSTTSLVIRISSLRAASKTFSTLWVMLVDVRQPEHGRQPFQAVGGAEHLVEQLIVAALAVIVVEALHPLVQLEEFSVEPVQQLPGFVEEIAQAGFRRIHRGDCSGCS